MALRPLLVLAVLAFAGESAADETVTFNKHIAPLLWQHCAECHRPGEVGPFSLLNYDDAAGRADFLAEITARRQMPPWKAEPNFGEFHAVRRLSEQEIELFRRWAEQGAPQGEAADLPEPPKFTEGWSLGEPDMIVKLPEPFQIPAQSEDIYKCFVLPLDLKEDRAVAAVEFRPGNRRAVHHAIFYLDHHGLARVKDRAEPGPGYTSFGGPGFIPDGGLGGWAPGSTSHRLPDGMAKYLRRGSDLVLQIHYHPTGKDEEDQSQVGIYFAPKPVERFVTGIAMIDFRLEIPPGDAHHEVKTESVLPVDVHVLGIAPHMHLLGREMTVVAEKPDGEIVPMISIKDWDFNWQDAYAYRQPVHLPKGTRLKLTAIYDNSADNPSNPSDPPRLVRFGEQTFDEMCLCTLQVYTDKQEDALALLEMKAGRLGAALGGEVPQPKKVWQAVVERLMEVRAGN